MMAGLDEILRNFALQKMQELKEKQENENATEETSPPNCYNGSEPSSKAAENRETEIHPMHQMSQTEKESSTPAAEVLQSKISSEISKSESEVVHSDTDEKTQSELNPGKTDPTSTKDNRDKKITIRLLTKNIETEPSQQEDGKEEAGQNEEMEEKDSSSDSSDDEDEGEVKDGKPWRKIYEEGELSPSSESEQEEEEGEEEAKSEKDNGMDTDSSGEIKDEDLKKSKKHKKHKHKKHKHSKDKAKDKELTKDKEKHRDKEKTKKEKKKDKERKEHKDKSKQKDKDREKGKNKKKSKDKKDKDKDCKDELDKDAVEDDSEKDKNKEKSEKRETKDKKHKSRHKDKGGDRGDKTKSSSKRKHRSGSRSRSRSPSKSKSSSHKKQKRSRSRSRSPKSRRNSRSTRSGSKDRGYYRSNSPNRYYSRRYDSGPRYRYRSRSHSKSPHSDDEFKIDKAKLLEIAKANAYAKMQSGEFPPYMKLTPKSVVTKVDSGEGRSVEELTAVCKEISSKQQDYSDSDDSPVNKPVGSDEENEEEPFIRHPFKVREAPLGNVGIVMNIKNAVQKPIQDKEMLRLTFPVSSGSQHRKKEDELGPKPYGDWVSVEKKPKMMDPAAKPTTKIMMTPGTATVTPAPAVPAAAAAAAEVLVPPGVTPVSSGAAAPSDAAAAAAAIAMPPPPVPPAPVSTSVVPPPVATAPPAPLTFAGLISPAGTLPTSSPIAAASAIPAAVAAAEFAAATAAAAVSKAMATAPAPAAPIGVAATPPAVQKEVPKEDKVFEEVPNQKVDIAAMVSARLKAARRLESNPNDVEALSVMHKAQTQIRNWTMGKQKPGMFTGDTGLRPLRPEELANTDPRAQAWAKRDMFHNQTPLRGANKGAMLMAKMGWRQGEGLGKHNEGALEPLALDVKTDRKGLVAEDEQRRKKNQVPKAVFKDLSGKHPVSALMEICNKRRWAPPSFELVQDKGPAHKKNFIFKVTINNEEYQPSISCPNKKQAKAQAAAVALQKMGLIPPDQPM